ncbi:MAG: aminoacyl-histidine dipeptidase [Paludibacter sp.]|nr:aminoacyl-histidine dipeptidase [Bacteroidales bacterium]MCM1068429.1 aminoacyl-histidine dipeptidase [Prevotella sp.]MCM1353384.1 aminoacyl-histidine dipeptidase [Bacteroides sp.]MCM1442545.1 aminoacyl-histidine dipeptidase [Muribaculum sp.]MCM1481390.1 aminoacyl-histidine dipeptidase [Paludibacter sp.]
MNIEELTPTTLWSNFKSLTQIPRPSGKKEAVSTFLVNYGKQLGLETLQDEIGNVLIRKPASPGMENHPGVILQGHMDMVPQKNNDVTFDFEKDPIRAYIDGEWVTADGTTLGADNGIGVATAMALLADKNAVHPPLEMLVTVDEETGMYGAFDLKGGWLQGKTLLNLDSEAEGELYVGCAGGVDTTVTFNYFPVEVPEGDVALKIVLTGLKGGHSGCDINLQRANANKLMFRFLKDAIANYDARLASVEGGSLRNAIPREAQAIITVPAEGADDIKTLVEDYENLFIREYDGIETDIRFSAEDTVLPTHLIPEEIQDALIHSVTACPNGVLRMIPEIPDVVETSNNLAVINTTDNAVTILCLTRSSVESRKEEVQEMIESCFALAGAKVEFSGSYPGWKPNLNSRILGLMQNVYQSEFGTAPRVITIHAGLECGIIGRNYPDMDMISFGPTIMHPHSPDEKVNIASVEKFYRFLTATLQQL